MVYYSRSTARRYRPATSRRSFARSRYTSRARPRASVRSTRYPVRRTRVTSYRRRR